MIPDWRKERDPRNPFGMTYEQRFASDTNALLESMTIKPGQMRGIYNARDMRIARTIDGEWYESPGKRLAIADVPAETESHA